MAVQEAPRAIGLVKEEVFEQARATWLERNRLGEFQTLRTVRSAISLFTHNAQTAERAIKQAAGGAVVGFQGKTQAEIDAVLAGST